MLQNTTRNAFKSILGSKDFGDSIMVVESPRGREGHPPLLQFLGWSESGALINSISPSYSVSKKNGLLSNPACSPPIKKPIHSNPFIDSHGRKKALFNMFATKMSLKNAAAGTVASSAAHQRPCCMCHKPPGSLRRSMQQWFRNIQMSCNSSLHHKFHPSLCQATLWTRISYVT